MAALCTALKAVGTVTAEHMTTGHKHHVHRCAVFTPEATDTTLACHLQILGMPPQLDSTSLLVAQLHARLRGEWKKQ